MEALSHGGFYERWGIDLLAYANALWRASAGLSEAVGSASEYLDEGEDRQT